jgi:hypothetical protein
MKQAEIQKSPDTVPLIFLIIFCLNVCKKGICATTLTGRSYYAGLAAAAGEESQAAKVSAQ